MVFTNPRETRLKNHTIDFNENTIINFPFGKAPELNDHFITDIKIANNANIDWQKISKAGSKFGDIGDVLITNPKTGQCIVWDGLEFKNADFPAPPFIPVSALPADTVGYRYHPGWYDSIAGTSSINGSGSWSGALTVTTNTVSFGAPTTSDGSYTVLTSNATDTNLAEIKINQPYLTRDMNFTFKCKFKLGSLTNARYFFGLCSASTLQVSSSDKIGTSNLGVGLRYSSSSDSGGTFKFLHNDGTGGASTADDTGITADQVSHVIKITADNTNSQFLWQLDNFGTITAATTKIPAATTGLRVFMHAEAVGANATANHVFWAQVAP